MTQYLIDREQFDDVILEPCCGKGAIAETLKKSGLQVIASDVKDYGYGEVRDLFDIRKPHPFIITNPPFSVASKTKRHLLSITEKKLALLWFVKNLGNELETKDSQYLKTVYVLGKVDFPEIKFGWKFAWFVWDKIHTGNIEIIRS